MQLLVIAGASGWLLVGLTAITVVLAFALRPGAIISRALGLTAKGVSFLRRMRPHYWLGYIIAGFAVVHVFLAMSAPFPGYVSLLGVTLASIGLCLVFVQLALGRRLRQPTLLERTGVRRAHLVVMLCIVALGAAHIALDSPALHALVR